jgi:hypothetical protein
MARPAELQPDRRWNGNRLGRTASSSSSSSSSHPAVSESRRLRNSAASSSSWRVVSEQDSGSLDESSSGDIGYSNMFHR